MEVCSLIDETYAVLESFILDLNQKKTESKENEKKLLLSSVSGIDNLSLVQLHILDLIKNNDGVNNAFISSSLGISRPGVTKAIGVLFEKKLIFKNHTNGKYIYYYLTDLGKDVANVHERLHENAKEKYYSLLKKFDDTELNVISKFLNEWKRRI